MATYSSNVTQKIGAGGVFNLSASADILTTNANEYAKVKIRGKATTSAGSVNFALLINGTIVSGGQWPNAGNYSLNEEAAPSLGGFLAALPFEVIVPPSSTLSLLAGPINISDVVVKGSFQKFLNTP